jgi:hypothetical protein
MDELKFDGSTIEEVIENMRETRDALENASRFDPQSLARKFLISACEDLTFVFTVYYPALSPLGIQDEKVWLRDNAIRKYNGAIETFKRMRAHEEVMAGLRKTFNLYCTEGKTPIH